MQTSSRMPGAPLTIASVPCVSAAAVGSVSAATNDPATTHPISSALNRRTIAPSSDRGDIGTAPLAALGPGTNGPAPLGTGPAFVAVAGTLGSGRLRGPHPRRRRLRRSRGVRRLELLDRGALLGREAGQLVLDERL